MITGIGILETVGEFRVTETDSMSKLYGEFKDGHYTGNKEHVKKVFAKSFVFDTLAKAIDKAVELANAYSEEQLDNGIFTVSIYKDLQFKDL